MLADNGEEIVPDVQFNINNKTVYAFGDSIVYGHTAPRESFMQLIANTYTMNLHMYAKNGASIMPSSKNILAQIMDAPSETPDLIVFDGYTNDAYGSRENDIFNLKGDHLDISTCYGKIEGKDATVFDNTTFCGAFEETLHTMQKKWPKSKLVFVTIHRSGGRDWDIQTKLRELSMEICSKWEIEVIDMYNYVNANGKILDTRDSEQMKEYIIDGAGSHPNLKACREFYVPAIVSKLITV